MCGICEFEQDGMERRDFLKTMAVATAAASIPITSSNMLFGVSKNKKPEKQVPTVCGAFVYPPSAQLQKEGY